MSETHELLVPAEFNVSKNRSEAELKKLEKDGKFVMTYENGGFYGALREFHRKLEEKAEAAGVGVQVRHQKLGQDYVPGSPGAALRAELIREEASELIEALAEKPAHYCLKEVCDLIYVTVAVAVLYGWELENAFEIVHKNNMEKLEKGTFRADGKLVKPPGWNNANVKGCV